MTRTSKYFLIFVALLLGIAGLKILEHRKAPRTFDAVDTNGSESPTATPSSPESKPSGWHFEGTVTRFDYQGRPFVVGTLVGPYGSSRETDAEFILLNYLPKGEVPIGQRVKCRVYRATHEAVSGDYPSTISFVARLTFVENEPSSTPQTR